MGQRVIIIKFHATATKTYEMWQQVYSDKGSSGTRVFYRHKQFREGRESVEDGLHT